MLVAKYSEQFYHDGYIHYEFISSYNRDLSQLEEIEISRQVLGVCLGVGVMSLHFEYIGYRIHQLRSGRRFTRRLQAISANCSKSNSGSNLPLTSLKIVPNILGPSLFWI